MYIIHSHKLYILHSHLYIYHLITKNSSVVHLATLGRHQSNTVATYLLLDNVLRQGDWKAGGLLGG